MKIPAIETLLSLYEFLRRVARKLCTCGDSDNPDPERHATYCEYRELAEGRDE